MSAARRSAARAWLRAVPKPPESSSGAAPVSDDDLIAAVVRGDGAVAAELYDRLVRTVDQTLFRVLGRRDADHEDLVQSSFEQIVKTLAHQRFAGACSLKTWASSVTSHVALNALRSRRRERLVFDKTDTDSSNRATTNDDPERDTSLKRELSQIRAQLAEMSPGRAEALLLHDVLGHDLAEIAALTGTSIAAAQSRLVRGRHELMERLGRGRERKGEPR